MALLNWLVTSTVLCLPRKIKPFFLDGETAFPPRRNSVLPPQRPQLLVPAACDMQHLGWCNAQPSQ